MYLCVYGRGKKCDGESESSWNETNRAEMKQIHLLGMNRKEKLCIAAKKYDEKTWSQQSFNVLKKPIEMEEPRG